MDRFSILSTMSDGDAYLDELETLLDQRAAQVEADVFPSIKALFRQMHSSAEALFTLFRKKGLLREDPYNYEERVSELATPSDMPYLESERDAQLSMRLTQYLTMLEYLVDYYEFSFESLSLKRLRELAKFIKYIQWRNMTESAPQPTTRGIAELVKKIKGAGDQLSTNIAADAVTRLGSAVRDVSESLKLIMMVQRERYKLDVRRQVLPRMKLPTGPEGAAADEAARKVKVAMARALPGTPFARELIIEIFTEDHPVTGDAARRALLSELAVEQSAVAEKPKGPDLRSILIDAARTIAGASRPLEEAGQRTRDNVAVLDQRKLSLGESVRAFFKRLFRADEDAHVLTVEYIDDQTGAHRQEEIEIEAFLHQMARRARLYNGLLARTGPAWTKVQDMEAERLLGFVTNEAQELVLIARRIASLTTYVKAELPRDQRRQLRETHEQVESIQGVVQRGRKRAHEYVAKAEEVEQLRRLGIAPTS